VELLTTFRISGFPRRFPKSHNSCNSDTYRSALRRTEKRTEMMKRTLIVGASGLMRARFVRVKMFIFLLGNGDVALSYCAGVLPVGRFMRLINMR
jgi:hypothetical protein